MVKDDSHKILLHLQKEFSEFKLDVNDLKKDMKEVKTTLGEHSEALLSIKSTVSEHTEALLSIESTLKFYGDMYKINKESNENLGKRVIALEMARV